MLFAFYQVLHLLASKTAIMTYLCAGVAELADAPGLGPGGYYPCRFKSYRPYQNRLDTVSIQAILRLCGVMGFEAGLSLNLIVHLLHNERSKEVLAKSM